jgi:tetratricopeptide (TPR) repeat protein
MHSDAWGSPLTASGTEAVAAYNRTVEAYLAFGRETGARLKALFAVDAGMPMAHVLRGAFMHLMATPALMPKARDSLLAARALAADCTPRERGHIDALGHWCDGEFERAVAVWEALLVDDPRDVLALKFATYLHFYLGDAAGIRDCVARVLLQWDASLPGYSYLFGMHAFGLEECGDYVQAERQGRRAVDMRPADAWAVHAVAHVMEMQDRRKEGIDWIVGLQPHWDTCNNFRYHLWWHRAIMHLALEDHAEVLRLYDESLFDPESEEYLDLCNDISLLARLEMAGVDVGTRWQALGGKIARQRSARILAFVDAHYVLGTAAAEGECAAAYLVEDMLRCAAEAHGTTGRVTRDVGVPLAEAIVAYRRGDYGQCVDRLAPVRRQLVRLGGSHAQRDLFAQMLIDAAMRAGRRALARALLEERLALRPDNHWARRQLAAWSRPAA